MAGSGRVKAAGMKISLYYNFFENYIVLEHGGVYTAESNLPGAKRYRNNSAKPVEMPYHCIWNNVIKRLRNYILLKGNWNESYNTTKY